MAALPKTTMAGLMEHMRGTWHKDFISIGIVVPVLASYVSWTLILAEMPFSENLTLDR